MFGCCAKYSLFVIVLVVLNIAYSLLYFLYMYILVYNFLINLCFSVGFRTTPMDSTGVSHILEHTTLCGSKHYPVRDPFFRMISRSLQTFMNAFTSK